MYIYNIYNIYIYVYIYIYIGIQFFFRAVFQKQCFVSYLRGEKLNFMLFFDWKNNNNNTTYL